MAKEQKPVTMISQVEKYLVKHKRMSVGDIEEEYGITPEQTHRMIYDLRKMGYPITSEKVYQDYEGGRIYYVVYSIPAKWSKKSLNK